jgi:hypothetical protein
MRAVREHAATGLKSADYDTPMQDIVREEEEKDDSQ